MTIVDTEVLECRNGYARVTAVPRESNMQHEQVFLQAVDGDWRIITYGTGITCTDDGLRPPEAVTACEQLGLR